MIRQIIIVAYEKRHYVVDLRGAMGPTPYRTAPYLQTDGTWARPGGPGGDETDSFESATAAIEKLAVTSTGDMIIAMVPELRAAVCALRAVWGTQ